VQHGFGLVSEVHYDHVPKSAASRLVHATLMAALPPHLRSVGFAFLFAKP
jgi:hypothetical protein